MKRFKQMTLALITTMIGSLAAYAQTAFDAESDGVTLHYETLTGETCQLVKGATDYTGEVSVPATVTYDGTTYSVASIAADAFAGSAITRLDIADGVGGTINADECAQLTSLKMGNAITDFSVAECSALETLEIGCSVPKLTAQQLGANRDQLCSTWNLRTLIIADGNSALKIESNSPSGGNVAAIQCGVTTLYVGRNLTATGDAKMPHFKEAVSNVEIGPDVTEIDRYLNDCISVSATVKVNNADPASITLVPIRSVNGQTTTPINIKGSILSVPFGSKSLYTAAEGWQRFSTVSEFAGTPTLGLEYTYDTTNKTAAVKKGSGYSEFISVVIPETTEYQGETYTVTSIGAGSFENCPNLTAVFIPNTVTAIGSFAFNGCSGLAGITLPNTVTSIRDCVFKECTSLAEIILSNSLGSISYGAFRGCTGLTDISIPNSVKGISQYAFEGCTALKNVILEEGEESIKICDHVFDGMTAVNFYIGRPYIFDDYNTSGTQYGLGDVANITFGKYVSTITKNTFVGCGSALETITIEDADTPLQVSTNLKYKSGSSYESFGMFSRTGVKTLYLGRDITCNSSVEKSQPFYGCDGLTKVTVGSLVTSLPANVFNKCDNLHTAYFLNTEPISTWTNIAYSSAVAIDIYVYSSEYGKPSSSKTYLHKLASDEETIIDGIHYYTNLDGRLVAAYCDEEIPANITLHENTAEIASYLFDGHEELRRVVIPKYVETVPVGCFYKCSGLRSLTLGTNVNTANGILAGTDLPKIICLPNSGLYLGNNGEKSKREIRASDFSMLSSWFEVDGVAYVPISNSSRTCAVLDVFKDVEGEYTFPTSVTYRNVQFSVVDVAPAALGKQTGLTKVNFPFEVTELPDYLFYGCTSLNEMAIPSTVTTIGAGVFENCTSLPGISLGNQISAIGSYAFSGCTSLTSLTLPTSLETISSYMFKDCANLSQVTMSREVKTIADQAFWKSGIESIYIPNSVTSIKASAFNNCNALKNIYFEDGTTEVLFYEYNSQVTYFSGLAEECELYIGRPIKCYDGHNNFYSPFSSLSNIKKVTIGETVTTIIDQMFKDCTGLTEVVLPNTVTTIGKYAFSGCTSLTDLQIPKSVVTIDDYAFNGCASLPSVDIPKSVTTINARAFYDCHGISSVTIPNSVTTIGDLAFGNCQKLTKVELVDGSQNLTIQGNSFYSSPIEEVMIGRNMTASPFSSKTTLKTAWLSDRLTTVRSSLFRNCSGLEKLYVGDYVETIGKYAFSGCTSLTKFWFGRTVTEIQDEAFSDCANLTDIYAEPMTPPTVYTQGLDDVDKWACTLHVPANAPYDQAEQWKEFLFFDNNFGVSLSQTDVKVEQPGSFYLTYTITGASKAPRRGAQGATNSDGVTWRSSNPDIATVDENGKVTVLRTDEQVTIAVFLPTGEMANCIINGPVGESIETSGEGQEPAAPETIALVDGEAYTNAIDKTGVNVTYTRQFKNTNWQPLYVPYNMAYEEWCDYADVAELYNVRGYDNDNDGVIDNVVIEFSSVNDGEIQPNVPYLIRAKANDTYTFSGTNKTLLASPQQESMIECSSTKFTYSFYGIYHTKADMHSSGAYTLTGGSFVHVSSDAVTLRPYRFYLMVTPKQGGYNASAGSAPQKIRISVDGEMADGIDGIMAEHGNNACFDLNGRKVVNPGRGIYIKNGKKVVIK